VVAEGDALLLGRVEQRDLLELRLQVAEEGDLQLRFSCGQATTSARAPKASVLDGRQSHTRTDIALGGCMMRSLGHGLDALLEILVVEPEWSPLGVALQDLAQQALPELHGRADPGPVQLVRLVRKQSCRKLQSTTGRHARCLPSQPHGSKMMGSRRERSGPGLVRGPASPRGCNGGLARRWRRWTDQTAAVISSRAT